MDTKKTSILTGWRERLREAWKDIPGNIDTDKIVVPEPSGDPLLDAMEPQPRKKSLKCGGD